MDNELYVYYFIPAGAEEEFRKLSTDKHSLQVQLTFVAREKSELEGKVLDVADLRKSLAEKTALVANLMAEDKNYTIK